jgi:predicted acetyltransferase
MSGHVVELTVPGPGPARALALSDVAVLPTHRRRGVMAAMMHSVLGAARERGEHMVLLGSSQGGIYGRFGFGVATHAARYVLGGGARLAEPRGGHEETSLVLLEPHEAAEALPAVFDLARRVRPGELARHDRWWAGQLEERDGEGAPKRFVLASVEGDAIEGYALYAVVEVDRRRYVALDECVTTTSRSYAAIFSLLCSMELTDGLRTGDRPVDEPLRHMLADPRSLATSSVCDGLWLRIVDVARALAARSYGGSGRVVIEVTDDLCPGNAGRFALEVGPDGAGQASPVDDDAELTMDVAALATLYLGGTAAASLRAAGRIDEHVLGAVTRVDAMMRTDLQPYCSTV